MNEGESPTCKKYWGAWDQLELQDGIVKYRWDSPDGVRKSLLTVVPESKVKGVVLEMTHASLFFGLECTRT